MNLWVTLGLKNSDYKKKLKEGVSANNTFATSVKKIGTYIAGAFAIAQVKSFFTTSIKLYKEQITVEKKLSAAIEANGKSVKNTLMDYKTFASELQGVTTIGDEVTLNMLRMAESLKVADPKQATKDAVGLSKALGVDLLTAIRMSALALEGNYTMLNRYVPALRTAGTEAQKVAAYQKLVTSGLAQAGAEIEDNTGKWTQLSNAYGDFKESIGGSIARNTGGGGGLTDYFSTLASVMNDDLFPAWKKWTAFLPVIFGLAKKELAQNEQRRKDALDFVDALNLQKKTKEELNALDFMIDERVGTASNSEDEEYYLIVSRAISAELKNRVAVLTTEISALDKVSLMQANNVTQIEDKIKAYEDLFDITDKTDKEQLLNITNIIAKLQKELDLINDIGTARSSLPSAVGVPTAIGATALESTGGTPPDAINGDSETQKNAAEQTALWEQQKQKEFQNTITTMGYYQDALGGLADVTSAFGDSSAATFANTAVSIIGSIGQMLISLNNLAIANGVANAFALPFPASIGAVATVLSTIGATIGAISGVSSSSSSSVSSSTSSTGNNTAYFNRSGQRTTSSTDDTIKVVIAGQDLVAVLNKNTIKNSI